ncbi:MAG: hypothetical protein QXK06_03345 [Candidatus Diapherotrites archaeon]
MKLLMVTKKARKRHPFLEKAFKEKGFEVKNVDIKEVSLFSSRGKSRIEGPKLCLKKTKAVYLEAGLKLTQFVEPLLDEIERRGIYCQVKAGSHYVLSNEPLQTTTLNSFEVRMPRTFIFRSQGKVKILANKLSYPALVKTFVKGEKTQRFIVDSPKALLSVADSVRHELDGIIVREFIEGDLDQCAVIGDKVYSIQRKFQKDAIQPAKKAKMSSLSAKDRETAIHAARICGCDIATVKMCKGYVLKVKPLVDFVLFNKKTGADLFKDVAELFAQKTGFKGVESP